MEKQTKILIGDDSAFMRKVLSDILVKDGFVNISEAANGNEVLEKYKAEQPDLIFLDMIMPDLGGMEVIKQIGHEAKIIVVSAVGQDSMIAEAQENGALGYIVKPFDSAQVMEELSKVNVNG